MCDLGYKLSGLFPTALTYNFPTEGSVTESVTYHGTPSLWRDLKISTDDLAKMGKDDIDDATKKELWNDFLIKVVEVISTYLYGRVREQVSNHVIPEYSPMDPSLAAFYKLKKIKEKNSAALLEMWPEDKGVVSDIDWKIEKEDVKKVENFVDIHNAVCNGYNPTHPVVYVNEFQDIGPVQSNDGDSLIGFHTQKVNVSANIGKEPLYEVGNKPPYFGTVDFPAEVITDFENYCQEPMPDMIVMSQMVGLTSEELNNFSSYRLSEEQIANGIKILSQNIKNEIKFAVDEPSEPADKKCTCDFYTVIMRTGCVCGGK